MLGIGHKYEGLIVSNCYKNVVYLG